MIYVSVTMLCIHLSWPRVQGLITEAVPSCHTAAVSRRGQVVREANADKAENLADQDLLQGVYATGRSAALGPLYDCQLVTLYHTIAQLP